MPALLTDQEIATFIGEPKHLTGARRRLPPLRAKRGHGQAAALCHGTDGTEFQVVLRRSQANAFDFSAILAVRPPNSNRWFRLRRYNGRSHQHHNKMEGTRIDGFHIHTATERYQRSGYREDAYAEATDRYADYEGAVRCLVEDASLNVKWDPAEDQLDLFSTGRP